MIDICVDMLTITPFAKSPFRKNIDQAGPEEPGNSGFCADRLLIDAEMMSVPGSQIIACHRCHQSLA